MKRVLRWYDYITINIFWLGISTLSQTNGLLFPLLVQQFVGEESKGTFFGTIRLWGLMVAVLVQALAGLLSDRFGRKRLNVIQGVSKFSAGQASCAAIKTPTDIPTMPQTIVMTANCRTTLSLYVCACAI